MTVAVPLVPAPALLPTLRRLLTRLRWRTAAGLFSQSLTLGLSVGVLTWGIAAGLFRTDAAPCIAILPALLTTALWFRHRRAAAAPLTVLAQAEQRLHLHELWTTAWTLTSPLPSSTPATTPVAAELHAQIRARAEAAAQTASPAALLPLRLPTHGGLALILAGIGLGIGLRPQNDDANWLDSSTAPAAGLADTDPAAGPAGGHKNSQDATPPVIDPHAPVTLHQLTPAEAAQHKTELDNLIKQIDTPEKLKAAQAQLANLQKETALPADQLKKFDELLRAKAKALAEAEAQAAGNHTGTPPTGTDPPQPPGTDPVFAPVSLLNNDRTINPAVLRDAQQQFPEYTGALTRYVEWLAQQDPAVPATR